MFRVRILSSRGVGKIINGKFSSLKSCRRFATATTFKVFSESLSILKGPCKPTSTRNNIGKWSCISARGINTGKYPPHTKVTLPALSPTMEKGNLVKWNKKEGDELMEGDLLAEIETDKATMGFETPEEGYLARIIIPENTKEIPLGKLLCIIVANKADMASFQSYTPTEDSLRGDAYPPPNIETNTPSPSEIRALRFPPHTKVTLPALSPTMEKGNLVKWNKKEGDELMEGDLLAEIETDKATMGFETPEEGYLARIIIPENTKEIPLGKLLCVIVNKKEDIEAFKAYTPTDDSLRGDAYPASVILEAAKQQVAENITASTSKSSSPPAAAAVSKASFPPHTEVKLPSLSPTMEKGNLQGWMVKEGEELKEGDVLAQIETDKATMDFETPEEGFLARIMVPAGTQGLQVGTPLCIIVDKKENVGAFKNYTPSQTPSAPATSTPEQSPPPPPSQPSTPHPQVTKVAQSLDTLKSPASPLAKRLALERGIDIAMVSGTGPGGSVTAGDVQSFKPPVAAAPITPAVGPTPPPPPPPSPAISGASYIDIPLSNIRQVIAKRLLLSKQTIPHYYLTVDVHMDETIRLRKELNELLKTESIKLSVNDFIIKASALACLRVPEANSSWQESYIRQHTNVDINVAVATDNGLITPIVFNAHQKGLATIATDVVHLAEKAKQGKLQPHEFQGGTFTISNLGMFGIASFSAIINPPQSCILAVGGSQKRIVPDNDKGYRTSSVMSVTLSCDHRVVDGAVGAAWLAHFKKLLEKPSNMLL